MISLERKACRAVADPVPLDHVRLAPQDITTGLMMTLTTASPPSPSETQRRYSENSLVEIHSLIFSLLIHLNQWAIVAATGDGDKVGDFLANREHQSKITIIIPSPATFSHLLVPCLGHLCSLHSQDLKELRVEVDLPHFHLTRFPTWELLV